MAGIDPESDGLRKALERGHTATHLGLAGLLELVDDIDLAFDATSARAHAEHARLLAARGIRSVDLTPAALGPAIVPPVNLSAAPGRARGQPDHLRRPGDDPDRGGDLERLRPPLRGDRVDGLVSLGRPRHEAEHRRVHDVDRARARDDRRRARGQGDHHPQPGRPADHDAQHDLRRDRRPRSGCDRERDRRCRGRRRRVRPRLPPDHGCRSSPTGWRR